ncbi:MAG: biopolymer transporter ExbD [Spirochaetaceae bacterium]|jgi:biopolymer transport protein ExbD|nr:biopolymer transporter ExbD [Spirochaetaceae bacterium]
MKLERKTPMVSIPLNAMSDVAFLLLIFIMLVSLINYRKEVKIEYPEAENIAKVSDVQNLEIWIDKTGAAFIDGEPATLDAVEALVSTIYRTEPDTRIHIIADRNTSFENVNKVLQILQILEYRVVSLVVKDAE